VPTTEIRPGNEKRGTIVGPPSMRWDTNLYKNTNLTERVSLQFEAAAINARQLIIGNSEGSQRNKTLPVRQARSEAFLSNGMDQQEADDKHHRAGYAMN